MTKEFERRENNLEMITHGEFEREPHNIKDILRKTKLQDQALTINTVKYSIQNYWHCEKYLAGGYKILANCI